MNFSFLHLTSLNVPDLKCFVFKFFNKIPLKVIFFKSTVVKGNMREGKRKKSMSVYSFVRRNFGFFPCSVHERYTFCDVLRGYLYTCSHSVRLEFLECISVCVCWLDYVLSYTNHELYLVTLHDTSCFGRWGWWKKLYSFDSDFFLFCSITCRSSV